MADPGDLPDGGINNGTRPISVQQLNTIMRVVRGMMLSKNGQCELSRSEITNPRWRVVVVGQTVIPGISTKPSESPHDFPIFA
jgi:hypothetical protein